MALTAEQKVKDRIKVITRKTKHDLEDAGITQQAVADVAGISQGSVSNQFRRGQLTFEVFLAATYLLKDKQYWGE